MLILNIIKKKLKSLNLKVKYKQRGFKIIRNGLRKTETVGTTGFAFLFVETKVNKGGSLYNYKKKLSIRIIGSMRNLVTLVTSSSIY